MSELASIKNTMALNKVVKNLLPFNILLQTMGNNFNWTRGGVAIPFLQGAPGGGKTSILYGLCRYMNWGLVSTHFALKPLEETGGLPQFKDIQINGETVKATNWSLPDLMANLYKMCDMLPNSKVIWNLDDSHLLGPSHMNMLYELLTERSLRGFEIPQNVAITMAGNTSNKAGKKAMYSAIVNRCCLMPVHTEFEDWRTGFALGGEPDLGINYNIEKLTKVCNDINRVHSGVLAFLGQKTYEQFFHEEEQQDEGWGSPRSWTRFSNWLSAYEAYNNKSMEADFLLYLAEGHLSKEASTNFMQFYEIYSKVDINTILKDPKFEIPEDPSIAYAVAYSFVNHLVNNYQNDMNLKDYARVFIKYLNNRKELSVLMWKDVIHYEQTMKLKNISRKLVSEIEKIDNKAVDSLLSEITTMMKL